MNLGFGLFGSGGGSFRSNLESLSAPRTKATTNVKTDFSSARKASSGNPDFRVTNETLGNGQSIITVKGEAHTLGEAWKGGSDQGTFVAKRVCGRTILTRVGHL